MGLVEAIKKLFIKNPKRKEKVSKCIATQDTSGIFIPKYSDLSWKKRRKVNKYVGEINIEELASLVKYGNELYQKSHIITDLLLDKVLEEKEEKQQIDEIAREDLLKRMLESLILKEEYRLYSQELDEIYEEIILRTVALERYHEKKSSKVFDFDEIFKAAERIKRNGQLRTFESTVNNMKIFIFRIIQDRVYVRNKINVESVRASFRDINTNSSNLLVSNNNYNDESITKDLLIKFIREIIELLEKINPKEAKGLEDVINGDYDKESWVKIIAEYRYEVSLYAYKRIKELDLRVSKLSKCQKCRDNKAHFMKIIDEIEQFYVVFRKYLKEKHLLNFYQLKFLVLCVRLDLESDYPFENINDEHELSYYKKILEKKLRELLSGENKYFQEEFGDNLNKAIELVIKIINEEIGDFSIEKILNNKKILAFINSFDKEGCLSEFIKENHFTSEDLVYDIGDIIWNKQLPLVTLYQLEKMIGNVGDDYIKREINPWLRLLCLGNTSKKIPEIEYSPDSSWIVVTLPEGIVVLRNYSHKDGCYFYERKLKELLNQADEIVCPSTLRVICKFLSPHNLLEKITFNEGLVEIGPGAFENSKLKELVFPKTLKEIQRYAFSCCRSLTSIFFNESLKDIGVGAFSGCNRLKMIHLQKMMQNISRIAFANCSELGVVYIEESDIKLHIGLQAFYGCRNLNEFNIAVKEIDWGYRIFDGISDNTININICIRGIEVEKGLIRNCIYSEPHVNKVITIMDDDIVAVRYVIPLDDTDYSQNIPLEYAVRNKIIEEIMCLLEEYKSKKNSSVSVLSKKG